MNTRVLICVLAMLLAGCAGRPLDMGKRLVPLPVKLKPTAVERFAVIGDYGCANFHNYTCTLGSEAATLRVVGELAPDEVISVGDNNYGPNTLDVLDEVLGSYYGNFIAGTRLGMELPGEPNRFWPAPGNHDWYLPTGRSDDIYRQYFALAIGTTNHYYDVELGPVHLFSLDSGYLDTNGTIQENALDRDLRNVHGAQARWLEQALAGSTSCFNIVIVHHPPFSSGSYAVPSMRWPFKAWGADVVMSGHEHFYEHIDGTDGMTYLIDGIGGANLFMVGPPNQSIGSLFTFGASPDGSNNLYRHGALLMIANGIAGTLHFELHTADGEVLDPFTIERDCSTPHIIRPTPPSSSDGGF